ncbi:DNA polymerase III PolC-type [Corynebacterium atrinae]|uniref:exonuclease domain-containing protein n=1 Tax=Corynebacterium atrinae TaxID=1336740 RepID=UPI0025B46BBD|nr:exonuclease domain-containing protein [Corynebacterium atrinae]WJY63778.1 DNA polymerase III PolC-type [Corynebacterium atrinae]
MISAHGAQLRVTKDAIVVDRSALAAALYGTATVTVPLASVTGVRVTPPSLIDVGFTSLLGADVTVSFAPGQEEQARLFAQTVEAALRGETVEEASGVPGLDFVSFDVETANSDSGSICQVGLIRYVDGVEVAAESWLCAPPPAISHFDSGNIAVHGINPAMVADQPTFADILPRLAEFVGELPLVAHNAQFDTIALERACRSISQAAPPFTFACSLALSRHAQLGLRNHRLPTVAAALGVALEHHHDASSDARAAGEIVVTLARRAGHEGSLQDFQHSQGFILGHLSHGVVHPVLKDRSGARIALQARGEVDVVEPPHDDGAQDSGNNGRGSRRPAPWKSFSTPDVIPEPNLDADSANPLYGHNVTLSGDFEPFDKGLLWTKMAELGATIGKNVTRKTTILVAGDWATPTSKQKRAQELIDKGQGISIWTGEQLFAVLGLDPKADTGDGEQPPF